MTRTACGFSPALLAGALWLGWMAEHEHTSIRAPWTGVTLVASGIVFVAAGVVGRGWRALASPVIVVPVALALTDLLVLPSVEVDEEFVSSCDPGCIPTWFFVLTLTVAASLLVAIGIVLRRALWILPRTRGSDDAS